MKNLNLYFDHTFLKPEATFDDIKRLCEESINYSFYSVCVNQSYVSFAKSLLKGSNIKVCAVVGFPFGANDTETKIFETERSLKLGADEIDMVMNIGYMKSKKYEFITEEIRRIKNVCGDRILKVIVETSLLNLEEKKLVVKLLMEGNADFIKTSTGFSTSGATVEDIKLFKDISKGKIMIKASGGIRDLKTTLLMLDAGALRIGSSSSVKIMREYYESNGNN